MPPSPTSTSVPTMLTHHLVTERLRDDDLDIAADHRRDVRTTSLPTSTYAPVTPTAARSIRSGGRRQNDAEVVRARPDAARGVIHGPQVEMVDQVPGATPCGAETDSGIGPPSRRSYR